MDIKKVTGVYFQPGRSNKTVVQTAAAELARLFKAECRYYHSTRRLTVRRSISLPRMSWSYSAVRYAGKLPNKISPDFARILHGTATPALALVTYGGRAYDNALAEMCELLTKQLQTGGRRRFLCRHVFSDKLAAGRPDAADLGELRMLAQGVARKLRSEGEFRHSRCPAMQRRLTTRRSRRTKRPQSSSRPPTTAMVLCEHCGLCENLPDGCD